LVSNSHHADCGPGAGQHAGACSDCSRDDSHSVCA
jgi:hypothetical protein